MHRLFAGIEAAKQRLNGQNTLLKTEEKAESQKSGGRFASREKTNKKVCRTYEIINPANSGGDKGIRTLDLTDANRTLSQLSYAPIIFQFFHFPGCGSRGWQERYAV